MEDRYARYKCPECGVTIRLKVRDGDQGKEGTVKCPRCGKVVIVTLPKGESSTTNEEFLKEMLNLVDSMKGSFPRKK